METLKEIKQELAEEYGCNDWTDLILTFHKSDHEALYDKVAIRYANQKLDEAAEKAYDAVNWNKWSASEAEQSILSLKYDL